MEDWLCHLHIIFFSSPPSLPLHHILQQQQQQQTKSKMLKSFCVMLAAVIFLGVVLDGAGAAAAVALTNDATAESSSFFNRTDASVKRTESVTVEGPRGDRPTPAAAETKFYSTTTVRGKQLDTKNISKEVNNNKEEEEKDEKVDRKGEDGKNKLGKKKYHLNHLDFCKDRSLLNLITDIQLMRLQREELIKAYY